METRAVIGTAGHVDHGKTTLVRELTGIDTDRLPEEKARGISIELGFAWLPLAGPRGGRAAIVDVPGHERFVRQMIAGAAGIDLVLLVVAADEGVMPQTREHLDICRLLGVRGGAVVLTKRDLVDAAFLELVREDVREAVAGTALEGAPVVPFAAGDAADRARVAALVAELVDDAEARGLLAARSADRPFKLSVDRVLSMHGFGTVVTGTTAAGELAVGDAVAVLSRGEVAVGRVRGIEVHGEAVARVGPGVRAALNLAGVDHDEVHRGDVIAAPGGLRATSMIDATVTALATLPTPIRAGAKALLHVGTTQVEATIALIGADALAPGDTGPAQLRLTEPRAVLPGERFVLSGFAALPGHGHTIGGGRALAASLERHKRRGAAAAALIAALDGDDAREAVRAWVGAAGEAGVPMSELAPALPFDGAAVEAALGALLAAGVVAAGGGRLYGEAALAQVEERAVAVIRGFHAERPAARGLREEELRTRIRGSLAADLLGVVVARGVERGRFSREGAGGAGSASFVRLASFQPRRSADQDAATERVHEALRRGGLTPPRVQDLPGELRVPPPLVEEALSFLVDDGVAVRVSRELVFDRGALDGLEAQMRAHFAAHELLDTATFKEITGGSRKWVIPLSEYFDRVRLTVRVGDARRLRGDVKPA